MPRIEKIKKNKKRIIRKIPPWGPLGPSWGRRPQLGPKGPQGGIFLIILFLFFFIFSIVGWKNIWWGELRVFCEFIANNAILGLWSHLGQKLTNLMIFSINYAFIFKFIDFLWTLLAFLWHFLYLCWERFRKILRTRFTKCKNSYWFFILRFAVALAAMLAFTKHCDTKVAPLLLALVLYLQRLLDQINRKAHVFMNYPILLNPKPYTLHPTP